MRLLIPFVLILVLSSQSFSQDSLQIKKFDDPGLAHILNNIELIDTAISEELILKIFKKCDNCSMSKDHPFLPPPPNEINYSIYFVVSSMESEVENLFIVSPFQFPQIDRNQTYNFDQIITIYYGPLGKQSKVSFKVNLDSISRID